ncbi:MAG TPA: hypothetical protein VMT98_07945 [Verrucomicrobiae bacterium]|nr:hypothetical protein [Verrucomicrobiae bacterium]
MGYAVSWLAFDGADHGTVLRRIGVSETSEPGRIGEAKFLGGVLPTGWFLIAARGCDHALIGKDTLAIVSQDRDVVACSIEEHVMYCSCALWRDGNRQWLLQHRGDKSLSDLEVSGNAPPNLAALRADADATQAREKDKALTVDWYFELVADLAKGMTGFRHDEETAKVSHATLRQLSLEKDGLLSQVTRPWWKLW